MRAARKVGGWIGALIALGVGVTVLVLWLRTVLAAGTTLPVWLFVGLTLGVNMFIWTTAGALRLVDDGLRSRGQRRALGGRPQGSLAPAAADDRPEVAPPPAAGMTLASLVQDQRTHHQESVVGDDEGTSPHGAVAVVDREVDRETVQSGDVVRADPGAETDLFARADLEPAPGAGLPARIRPHDIAILMCAHNEELVIGAAIRSAARLVPASNIYVASDASIDATAEIARQAGVNVLEIYPNKGKAGAIATALEHFALTDAYEGVLVLDADSELDERYLTGAVQLFADPEIAAVAGYAETVWKPREQSAVGQFITAYRDRLYLLLQAFNRFGQTWRHTNVAYIVPGFASVYRSSALKQIDVNPRGMVIEDFNMTFELHHKKLGRIGFKPGVKAYCQDPHTLGDYVRQVRRWTLGFWQTVRRHGFWPSLFWVALAALILEVVVTSIGFLGAIGLAVFLALPVLTGGAVLGWDFYAEQYALLSPLITLPALAFGIFVPDYFMTCMVAAYRKRPRYLILGLGFLALRTVDAVISIRTIPQGWTTRSTGVWKSPVRH